MWNNKWNTNRLPNGHSETLNDHKYMQLQCKQVHSDNDWMQNIQKTTGGGYTE